MEAGDLTQRVCLVGAGTIAQVHAQALRAIPGVKLHGVIDPNAAAAAALAARWHIPRRFASASEALASGEVDRVHVLTPPNLHAAAALPFLAAGKPVLVEKPLAVDGGECRRLDEAARQGGTRLGVNQNFVYHPAFVRLRRLVTHRALGRPSAVSCLYSVGLRQWTARHFDHWMFRTPVNILLEQAVHPLSQIVALAGPVAETRALAGLPIEISPGLPFYPSVGVTLRCGECPADLHFALGQPFPVWRVTAVCDDGVAIADILNNRLVTYRRTRWPDFCDGLLSGGRTAAGLLGDSIRNSADFLLSTARLKPRSDGFYQSIARSIGAFHAALDADRAPELDGRFGSHLVTVCQDVAAAAFPLRPVPVTVRHQGKTDITVLGGTGFIGGHLVQRLLDEGLRVGVMARNIGNPASVFTDNRVVLTAGDVRNPDDVAQAIGQSRIVVNLAHGGGGEGFEAIRAAMVGSARTVATACHAAGVTRLIHIGSIASLYLGPDAPPVTSATPPDPRAEIRADYARAKAECDRLLLRMHRDEALPVCILRPGLVVGENGPILHSGLGIFNNDQHCIGWNRGDNPLPFVLVEDVAAAIWLATRAADLSGRSLNLVGDVRMSARAYLAELGRALERPIRFHPSQPDLLWLEEQAKGLIKRALGRRAAAPSRHDLRSRGMSAAFLGDDTKAALGWRPESDPRRFLERALWVHAAP